VGLIALLAAGLAAFGIATYSFYAPSQYQQLDAQLRTSATTVSSALEREAGIDEGNHGPGESQPGGAGTTTSQPGNGGGNAGGPGGPGGPPPLVEVPSGTVGILFDASTGKILDEIQYGASIAYRPQLPRPIAAPGPEGTLLTTGSTGSIATTWRVLISALPAPEQDAPTSTDLIAVAFPTSSVDAALSRLVLVEVLVAISLLAVLAALSWLLLWRGTRPLEQMASEARTISGSDVSRRIGPAKGPTEVVELGRAIDRMLDGIEHAFAERDATEDRLRQFLADASHELRTPLTSIRGFAELLRLGANRGDTQLDQPGVVRRIESEAARMSRLIDDLLLLARLDRSRPVQIKPVDLAVIAADACSDGAAADPERGFSLDAPTQAIVKGDEDHLRQAVANRVTNAVRHTTAGTPVEVSVHTIDSTASLEVRDHGSGLDETALEHVFDRFWQADRARAGEGAGLGLAIVAAVAAEHGGSASAGNAPGGGGVFSLRIPLAQPEVVPPEVDDGVAELSEQPPQGRE